MLSPTASAIRKEKVRTLPPKALLVSTIVVVAGDEQRRSSAERIASWHSEELHEGIAGKSNTYQGDDCACHLTSHDCSELRE